MPTAEVSNAARSRPQKGRAEFANPLVEPLDEDEVWDLMGNDSGPLTDEEIVKEAARRYEELRTGKVRGLTWEEYQLFNRLGDEFPELSDQAIFAEIDRRYEERQKEKTQGLGVEEYEFATQ